MNKQLSFNDMVISQKLNNEIISEVYKLRETILKLDEIGILPNYQQLSEFNMWRADVFQHINNIIYDYKLHQYR